MKTRNKIVTLFLMAMLVMALMPTSVFARGNGGGGGGDNHFEPGYFHKYVGNGECREQ